MTAVIADGAAAPDRLEPVWRAVADDFRLVDPQDADAAALSGLHDDLYGLFTGLGVTDVSARLALPADYAHFLALAGGFRRRSDDVHDIGLFDIRSVWSWSDFSCRLFAGGRPAGASMWLTVAEWSDRHELALCCDRADPRFGAVVDCKDDHPWLGGRSIDPVGASFTDFLASLS
ncbi:hypothetical protein [Polymorphospora sp. NPDC050346]|uniref:hypothetical protein n=1 Tax=Polymorphospora sp. NPDC050346 TaxID=3155780 RepID=UPI0033F36E49